MAGDVVELPLVLPGDGLPAAFWSCLLGVPEADVVCAAPELPAFCEVSAEAVTAGSEASVDEKKLLRVAANTPNAISTTTNAATTSQRKDGLRRGGVRGGAAEESSSLLSRESVSLSESVSSDCVEV